MDIVCKLVRMVHRLRDLVKRPLQGAGDPSPKVPYLPNSPVMIERYPQNIHKYIRLVHCEVCISNHKYCISISGSTVFARAE